MFIDRLIGALKNKKSIESNDDKKLDEAINKIQKQKRLSSQEFFSVYDSIWKEGAAVRYQNPDEQVRHFAINIGTPKPINFKKEN